MLLYPAWIPSHVAKYLDTMPPMVFISLAGVVLLFRYLKEPVLKMVTTVLGTATDKLAEKVRLLVDGKKHQTLLTPEEHAAQASRRISLHQYTQYVCDALSCDNVAAYANMNGESLKSKESIEKLFMMAEGVALADQSAHRYMWTHRTLYTCDMPNLLHDVYTKSYALMHQDSHPDPFIRTLMRKRGYESGLAMQIISIQPNGEQLALGVVFFMWHKLLLLETADGHNAWVTPKMEELLSTFKLQFSDRMDFKHDEDNSLLV